MDSPADHENGPGERPLNRRDAVKRILWTGIAAASMLPVYARRTDAAMEIKPLCTGSLSLVNPYNRETLQVRYLGEDGRFDPDSLERLNRFFRCPYTHKIHVIDPVLFLLLDAVRYRLGANERTIRLVSGYRSPEYNRLLRSRTIRAAKKSYHLKGMAADIQIHGVRLRDLQSTAKSLKMGGVGRYSRFAHLDVGPLRYW